MALNLVQHRAAENVWDKACAPQGWDTERWLAAVVAGALLLSGLRRRSATGLLMAVGGSSLAWWAAAGADERNQMRGQLQAAMPTHRAAADLIGEASEESFPASDAPSWTPTTGNTGPAASERGRWH
jgi:hypothetical protein